MNTERVQNRANETARGRGPMGRGGPWGPMNREKPKNRKQTLKRLFRYIGKSKYLVALMLGIMLLSTVFSLISPIFLGRAIDSIRIDSGQVKVDFDRLTLSLTAMGALYLLTALFQYLQNLFSAILSQKTVRIMRNDLFGKLTHLPMRYIDSHQHGDLMSRMTNDVDNISSTISQSIGSLFSGLITLVGTVGIMLYFSPLLTAVCLITVPLTILTSTKLADKMRKYFIERQTLLGSLNGQIEEMVTGYKTVIAYGKEKKAVEEFDGINRELRKTGILAEFFGGTMGPIMNILGNLGFLLVATAGGYLVFAGSISIGVMQQFITYSKQFNRPINEIANQYALIETAIAGAERVFEVMDAPAETDHSQRRLERDGIVGDIEFKHVVFSYKKNEPVLKGFDLSVKKGQKIAIVGATGAGKTTVVNLLTRFYDIDDGAILIDGTNITEYTRKSVRAALAIVLQDTVLFHDTVLNNIRYGRLDATEEEVVQAAKMADADLFIERLPNGYHTELAQAGNNISQGQRQLITIARAILADPKILILDEATSSVDTRTEMHIQNAMINLMKNRTSLIIAHRLSTIQDADVIVVVENGVVAEIGGHRELIGQNGAYYRLYQTQYAGIDT